MPAVGRFLLADRQNQGPVQLEGRDRRPAGAGNAEDPHAAPAEMASPPLAARIKQRHGSAGVGISRGPAGLFAK
jgi:hypothetical protein